MYGSDYGLSRVYGADNIEPGGAAGVRYDRSFTYGDTISMAVMADHRDGTPLDWSDLAFSYRLDGVAQPADAVVPDDETGTIYLYPPGPLAPGQHSHALAVTRISTGATSTLFEGLLTIVRSL